MLGTKGEAPFRLYLLLPVIYRCRCGPRRDTLCVTAMYFYPASILLSRQTESHGTEEDLRLLRQDPEPGSFIVLKASNSSCSLGAYFTFFDDATNYVLTVHHGISSDRSPIPIGYSPVIEIQQPSKSDVDDQLDEIQTNLEKAEYAQSNSTARHIENSDNWRKQFVDLNGLDIGFGEVLCTGFIVIDIDGLPQSSDWCITKVKPARVGINHVAYPSPWNRQDKKWTPRDRDGVYVRGVGRLSVGDRILKAARSTGTTSGEISIIYSHAKLERTA